MIRKKNLFLGLIYLLINISTSAQDFKLFSENNHFDFYKEDALDYTNYIEEFNNSYQFICQTLNLKPNHKITVKIFKNQKSFITEIYGYYEKKVTSVGMTKPEKNTVYITSFYDTTTGRSYQEYLKVIRHELVHALFFNEHTWLSEGIALYLAGQKREIINTPVNSSELITYIDCNIINKEAYGYYSFFTRMMIEKVGLTKYLDFYKSDMDWNIIGYANAKEFCDEAYAELISSHNNK